MKPAYSLPTSVFLSCYAVVKRTGVLERSIPQWFFRKAYFLYKRLIEDPFHGFCSLNRNHLVGRSVIDIGANLGYTVAEFAKAVGPKGHVIAFEPEPANFSTLTAITQGSSYSGRVTAVQSAIGASSGTIELWLNPDHHADHRIVTKSFEPILKSAPRTASVALISLDEYLRTHPLQSPLALIKIDVQGYEPAVCEGMIETLTAHPLCWITFEHCPAQIEELGFSSQSLLDFFTQKNYVLYLIHKSGKTSPLTEPVLKADLARFGYAVLLAKPQQIGI